MAARVIPEKRKHSPPAATFLSVSSGVIEMNKMMVMACVAAAVSLSGCALPNVKPADVEQHIDPISIQSQANLNADVNECTTLANRSVSADRKKAIWGAVLGGLAGAAVGSAIGNHTGLQSSFAAAGAAQGTAMGMVSTLPYARSKQQRIIYSCLVHRGYALLY